MRSGAPMLAAAARTLFGLLVLVSLGILVRGHDHPGGGFIGGLMAVAATVILAAGLGVDAARRRLPLGGPVPLMTAGLLLALGSGLPALWQGRPYLTHLWGVLPLGFAAPKVSTAMLFDLGVYLCVWGALAGYALALLAADEAGARP